MGCKMLEQQLAELTAAVNKLTITLERGLSYASRVPVVGALPPLAVTGPAVPTATDSVAKQEGKSTPPSSPVIETHPGGVLTDASGPASPAEPLTYDGVAKVINAFNLKHGRDATLAKLAKFNDAEGKPLTSLKKAREEDFAAIVEAFK